MSCALVFTSLECPSNRIGTENAYVCAVPVDLDAYERLGDFDKRFDGARKMSAGSRIDSAYVPDHFAAVTGWVQTYDGLEVHRRRRRFVRGALANTQ
jgi:hypothetical protein